MTKASLRRLLLIIDINRKQQEEGGKITERKQSGENNSLEHTNVSLHRSRLIFLCVPWFVRSRPPPVPSWTASDALKVFPHNMANNWVGWWASTFNTSSCPTRRAILLQTQTLLLSIDSLTRVSRCERLSSEICKRFNEHFNWLYDYIIKRVILIITAYVPCAVECSYTLIKVIKVFRRISTKQRQFCHFLERRSRHRIQDVSCEGVNGVIETLEQLESRKNSSTLTNCGECPATKANERKSRNSKW